MRSTGELETRLTAMLRDQAESIFVRTPAAMEVRMASAGRTRSLRARVLSLGMAGLACVVLIVVVAQGGDRAEQVRTGPAASDDIGPVEATTTLPPAATTSADAAGPFRAETRQVSLTADAVTIDAGGKRFVAAGPLEVSGDPGELNEYTTLELTWREHGVEMRLFVYFNSDGREWWSNEIRTYDGKDPGEWITYTGDYFRRPLGTPFVGDLTVATPDPAVGRLHVVNLRLEAFLRPAACATATGPFALEPGTSPITIEGFYGAGVQLLDTASCTPVPDEDRYTYQWETRDPSVVTVDTSVPPVEPAGRRAQLRPNGKGRTVVHVTARDPGTGAAVAEADIEVVVGDIKAIPPPSPGPVAPRP